MYKIIALSNSNTNSAWLAVCSAIFLLIYFGLSSFVHAETNVTTVEKLRKELVLRDAVINDLLQRVKQLENLVGVHSYDQGIDQSHDQPPSEKARVARSKQPRDTAPSKPTGPGSFKVDEKSAERALERSLNVSGALLLPAWSVEIQPFFSYSRNDQTLAQLFNRQVTPTNETSTASSGLKVNDQFSLKVKNKQNSYQLGLTTRVGLPFDSQLELTFPYRFVSVDNEISATQTSLTDSTFQPGDLSIGIAKTLLREKNWWPDIIGRIRWDSATGETEKDGVFLGDGMHELQFSFTALKRLDPLALFGTVAYQMAFEKNNALSGDDFKQGDQYTISLGTSLATSPETSLSATLQTTLSEKDERNGHRIFGTDQLASSLVFGASWIVGKGSLITFSPAIGLTNDAADFSASLSWSYRLR